MTFKEWYNSRYPSKCSTDYIEWDYLSHPTDSFVELWWLDRELEEAFNAGKEYQKQKGYEFDF